MPVRERTRTTAPEVLPTNEARSRLSATSRAFVERGAKAAPVFFGPHRKPVGVMLSYEFFVGMLDLIDDLAIAAEVRRRDQVDDGSRLSLEELAREHGFEPEDVGL
jgi:hypothetical protein